MQKRNILFICCLQIAMINVLAGSTVPYLKKNRDVVQLMVNDKPFLIIAGELHNSSTSTVEYMLPVWDKLVEGNLNTVLAAVAWQQLEPQEGIFDFTLVDSLIKNAEEHNLKLILLWFGTWKNGESSYVPDWVKKDTDRFFRVKNKEGKNIETISPFCEEAKRADGKAFGQLMAHLAKVDTEHTVIMVQPENEMGVFQEIDYSEAAVKAFNRSSVPEQLIQYLKENENNLTSDLRKLWIENGKKEKGNWIHVFGDTPYAKEFFMASQYATYVDWIAGEGKKEYHLPMFINAWIIQTPTQMPGQYPNGGPVSRVLDIYKALAENIDILSPDIYLPDFKEEVAKYKRADNPLLVPESKYEPGRAFYSFAECDALGFAIFGIEDYTDRSLLQETHRILHELQPMILEYQGSGNMRGFLRYKERTQEMVFGKYRFRVSYPENDNPAFGMIVQTDDDEFLVAGVNFDMVVTSVNENKTAYFLQIWEGEYKNGEWEPYRLLNGDETLHNSKFMAFGKWIDDECVPRVYKLSVYIRE